MGQTLGKVGKPGDQVQVLREHATSKGVQGSNNPHHNLNNNLNNVIFHKPTPRKPSDEIRGI